MAAEEIKVHGSIMATALDKEGKPAGEPFEFATGGVVKGARIIGEVNRRSLWNPPVEDPDRPLIGRPISELSVAELDKINWPLIATMLGVYGARDDEDVRLAMSPRLTGVPGTAAHGAQLGRWLQRGGVYTMTTDRELRFVRAGLEARGLRLFELTEITNARLFYVCTPGQSIRYMFERLREAVPVPGRRFSEHARGLAVDVGARPFGSRDEFVDRYVGKTPFQRAIEWRPITTVAEFESAIERGHEIQFRSRLHRHVHVAPSTLTRQPDSEQRDV